MSTSAGATAAAVVSRLRTRRIHLAALAFAAAVLVVPPDGADARRAQPGLVAAYAFDEGSGATSADASGNGHTATLHNVRWIGNGRFGRAVAFNGRTSLVQIADSAGLDLSGGMTMEAWIRPRNRSGTDTIIAKTRAGGGFPYGLELRRGRPAGFGSVGSRKVRAGGRKVARSRKWHFVATTFDGKTIRAYLDGKQVAKRRARGSLTASDGALEIGGNSVWREGFRGAIDNVRVYRRALSAKQLRRDRRANVAKDVQGNSSPNPSAPGAPKPGTPSPPTPPSNGRNCMADPSACGYPDVENTGVRPGTPLAPMNGAVTLSTPGQVLENRLVTGSITVTAPNVTIRNVKLIATDEGYGISSFGWRSNTSGLLLENVEIDLNGHLEIKGIAFDDYTARRVLFRNGSDCAHFGSNVVIEHSLCVTGPDANADGWPDNKGFCNGPEHFDGFQSDGGGNIRLHHNTIRVPCEQTSAILMSTNTSGIRDVTITDNLMAGGGYTLYCNAGPDVPNETVTGNRFSRTFFPKGGYWGATTNCEDADVYSGNIWDETGAPAR